MGILTKAVSTIGRALGLTSPQLVRWFAGGETAAGETVSVNSALQLDTVFACVKLIATTIATMPLHVYLNDSQGRGTIARDHPLYRILHDQPNAEMSAVMFWQAMVACVLLWGNGYARIDRAAGRVVSLYPLLPSLLSVKRLNDGSLEYRYSVNGRTEVMNEGDVFHLRGFSLDGVTGIAPIGQARETLGIAIAAERSAGSFFRNAMRPSLALIAPTYFTPDQRERFKEKFIPEFTGSINAGKVPVVEGDWKIQNLSMNPDDAQLLATRAFSVEQICRWYGVQPVMVGHMEKSTAWGSGLEQMNLWFLTYTLRPLLKSIEQEIMRALVGPADRLRIYAEFNVEGLLRADSAGRAALMKVLAENGLRTRNELRALDNMPPMVGGDDLTVQANMMPVQDLGKFVKAALDKPLAPAVSAPANQNQPAA